MTTFAPCCNCHRMIYDIPLTGEFRLEKDGGKTYYAYPGGKCLGCGEPIEIVHFPPPDALKWDFSVTKGSNVVKNHHRGATA